MAVKFSGIEGRETSENVDNSIEQSEQNSDFERDFESRLGEDEGSESQYEVDKDGVRKLKCIREDLEGKTHPDTGVPYERKTVIVDGEKVEGVFPQFESQYSTKLPEGLYKESDGAQFKYCSERLKAEIKNNPELAAKFNERQLSQIEKGYPRIDGYTWHHTENPGEMQLVDSDIHDKTKHTGGRFIWGGGKECR